MIKGDKHGMELKFLIQSFDNFRGDEIQVLLDKKIEGRLNLKKEEGFRKMAKISKNSLQSKLFLTK